MSKLVYRNGKLVTVSDSEWRKTVAANRAKQPKHEGKNVTVTTEDGRKHRIGGIGDIAGTIGNLIVGHSGPVNTGSGDQYVNGKKQPKRNRWI